MILSTTNKTNEENNEYFMCYSSLYFTKKTNNNYYDYDDYAIDRQLPRKLEISQIIGFSRENAYEPFTKEESEILKNEIFNKLGFLTKNNAFENLFTQVKQSNYDQDSIEFRSKITSKKFNKFRTTFDKFIEVDEFSKNFFSSLLKKIYNNKDQFFKELNKSIKRNNRLNQKNTIFIDFITEDEEDKLLQDKWLEKETLTWKKKNGEEVSKEVIVEISLYFTINSVRQFFFWQIDIQVKEGFDGSFSKDRPIIHCNTISAKVSIDENGKVIADNKELERVQDEQITNKSLFVRIIENKLTKGIGIIIIAGGMCYLIYIYFIKEDKDKLEKKDDNKVENELISRNEDRNEVDNELEVGTNELEEERDEYKEDKDKLEKKDDNKVENELEDKVNNELEVVDVKENKDELEDKVNNKEENELISGNEDRKEVDNELEVKINQKISMN